MKKTAATMIITAAMKEPMTIAAIEPPEMFLLLISFMETKTVAPGVLACSTQSESILEVRVVLVAKAMVLVPAKVAFMTKSCCGINNSVLATMETMQ